MIWINDQYNGSDSLNDYWSPGICLHTEVRYRKEIAQQIEAILMGWA